MDEAGIGLGRVPRGQVALAVRATPSQALLVLGGEAGALGAQPCVVGPLTLPEGLGGTAGGPAEPAGEGVVFAVLGHVPSLSPRPVRGRGVRGHSPPRSPVA